MFVLSRLHVDRNVPTAFRARSKASFLESYALRSLELSLMENENLRHFAPHRDNIYVDVFHGRNQYKKRPGISRSPFYGSIEMSGSSPMSF